MDDTNTIEGTEVTDVAFHAMLELMAIPAVEDAPEHVYKKVEAAFSLLRVGFLLGGTKDRKAVFSALLEHSPSVFIAVFPHPKLQVPSFLGFPLTLEYGLNMANPIPDLLLEDAGIRATLSFNRTPTPTFIPWESIGIMRGANFFALYWADAQSTLKPEGMIRDDIEEAMGGEVDNKPKARPRLSLVPDTDGSENKE